MDNTIVSLLMETTGRHANGSCIMFAMLLDELDKRGTLSKAEFAKMLTDTARDINLAAQEQPGLYPRQEATMMMQVVKYLDLPRGKWTPTVIEGGKI